MTGLKIYTKLKENVNVTINGGVKMERIAGINEVRPKLTSFIESLKNDSPVVITINSEPKAVLLDYEKYRLLQKTAEENKRLALKTALAKIRSRAATNGLTQADIEKEIKEYREGK
ncbi:MULTISPECIES: type II toxin-antitoxin system Phd/YefM family antitoxin [unclassified Neomoorella]|uniref:type II toxin-antitoxin system Phd/YefM family antitoxin n=1 Tax=unclassified Neomoorella TaxID=2676739 RepID=UPI00209C19D6|nr:MULTISPECIES: type II toxin-antitoxin system Phd/YefM family antitoxin [unclassified Moorella (in: firmicutes)]